MRGVTIVHRLPGRPCHLDPDRIKVQRKIIQPLLIQETGNVLSDAAITANDGMVTEVTGMTGHILYQLGAVLQIAVGTNRLGYPPVITDQYGGQHHTENQCGQHNLRRLLTKNILAHGQ